MSFLSNYIELCVDKTTGGYLGTRSQCAGKRCSIEPMSVYFGQMSREYKNSDQCLEKAAGHSLETVLGEGSTGISFKYLVKDSVFLEQMVYMVGSVTIPSQFLSLPCFSLIGILKSNLDTHCIFSCYRPRSTFVLENVSIWQTLKFVAQNLWLLKM